MPWCDKFEELYIPFFGFYFFFFSAYHSDEALTDMGVSMHTEVKSLNAAVIIQSLTSVHTLLTPRVQLGLCTTGLTDWVSLQWVLLVESLYSGSYLWSFFTVGLTDWFSWIFLPQVLNLNFRSHVTNSSHTIGSLYHESFD